MLTLRYLSLIVFTILLSLILLSYIVVLSSELVNTFFLLTSCISHHEIQTLKLQESFYTL